MTERSNDPGSDDGEQREHRTEIEHIERVDEQEAAHEEASDDEPNRSDSIDLGVLSAVQDFTDEAAVLTAKIQSPTGSSGLFAIIQAGEIRAVVQLEGESTPFDASGLRGSLEADDKTLMTLLEPGRWPESFLLDFGRGHTADPVETYTLCVHLIEEHLDFPRQGMEHVVALWIFASYLHRRLGVCPYLAITGPKGSGKTKFLEVLYHLAFNALFTVNITQAALFRSIQAARATILLDEAEALSDVGRSEDLRLLLQSGYKAGASVVRASGEGFRIQKFDTYGPKALANIRGLESVLADRAIPIHMWRTAAAQGAKPVRQSDSEWGEVRAGLYSFALTQSQRVLDIYSTEDDGLYRYTNRLGELWRPILALASVLEQQGVPELVDVVQRIQDEHSGDVVAMEIDPEEVALALALIDLVEGASSNLSVGEITRQVAARLGPDAEIPDRAHVGRMMRRLNLGHPRRTGTERRYFVVAAEVTDFLKRMGG